ncbi:hypothetical protein GIY23_19920 [Allosaccharopolyspora coralli]|uniref:Uncharacterized protein n=1 Tax=Allosaccharopolyspora coralli TaxID=2665642 RepID=A0A5Q3QIW5_9PSEU|nr:hypothetical protein [Allosaccharopolyspora coralli]QGK71475.1 hypothetical protein GIY23_19920 [Allosaccharopolyspora coralli]
MPQVAPKPDVNTGEPRPPQAPVITTWENEGRTNRDNAKFPPAPEREGPVLEWYQGKENEMVKGGFALSVAGVIFLCILDTGFSWMSNGWLWLSIAWPPVVFYFLGRSGGYSAGAEWFATRRKGYVRLYELQSVKVDYTAGGQSISLELTDIHGGFAGASLRQLQRKRALWDLVYNGIAYSVLHGRATANNLALDKLKLR